MTRSCFRAMAACVAVAATGSSWAASPSLANLYRVGSLGLVDFSTSSGNEIVGRYRGKGSCDFEEGTRVVSGSFEGNVFVGQVTLCQEGAGCESPQSFPILGFAREKQMVALVKFEPGCSSKATDHRQLVFKEADPDDKAWATQTQSTSQIATRNRSRAEQCAKAVSQGQALMQSGDFRQAKRQFQLALAQDDTSPEALLGLSITHIKLGEAQSAVTQLFKALRLSRNRGLNAQIHYNLACAYASLRKKREALKSLNAAIEIDSKLVDEAQNDPDLESLRSDKNFPRR